MTQECITQNATEKCTGMHNYFLNDLEKLALEKAEIGQKNCAGFVFTGKEWEAETGTYYFGARRYDPTIGQWYGRDPAGQFESPYVYA
jgi:RHS repeat-associated protein